MKIIKKVGKEELQDFLYDIDLNDSHIYEELRNENTIGIFQFNGTLASGITRQVKPTNFDEMIAINSLARPGTSSFTEDYIAGRDKGVIKYPPIVNDLLKDTYGLCIFQESVMNIFNIIGGFSLEATNDIRGLMKKLGKAEKSDDDIKKWDKAVKKFTKGAIENGLTEDEASRLAEDLLGMSEYQFNKSHATSYSYIAAMTLYLSYYFKRYFLSSVLQNHIDDGKEVFEKIQAIRNQGIEILPPDINKSHIEASSLDKTKLLLGLKNIKKVSDTSAEHIIERRPYDSLFDFITKTEGRKIRIDVIKALISIGAFDFETPERKRLLFAVELFWKNKKSIKVKEKLQVIWDKAYKEAMHLQGLNISNTDLKDFENEYLGGNFFTSSFPNELLLAFNKLRERNVIYYSFNEVSSIPKKMPVNIQNLRLHVDKNGNEMAFITVEDVSGRTERLPVFASYWKYLKNILSDITFCLIQIYLTEDGYMFGSPMWVDNKKEIIRMVRPIQ